MKIKSIEAFAITNPIAGGTYEEAKQQGTARRPPWTKDAEVANPMSRYPRYKALRASWRDNFPAVGVIVTADDGSWGFGTTGFGQPTISLINDHIGPLLEGENALATEKLYDMMMRITSPYSSSGLASYAISGIDLALWDLKGRVLKLPVYELAGGAARDKQFCYATGNDTDWHMELGFKATKLACPYGTADGLEALDKNEAFVGKARELIGPHVELMLDCWMALRCRVRGAAGAPAEAVQPEVDRGLPDPRGPLLRTRHCASGCPGRRWPRASTGTRPTPSSRRPRIASPISSSPISTGSAASRACQKITAIADAAGLEVICHAGMNTPYGQHFTFSSTNSRWGEYFVGGAPGQPLLQTNNYPGMAVPKDGYVVVSDAPGFGHGLDLEGHRGDGALGLHHADRSRPCPPGWRHQLLRSGFRLRRRASGRHVQPGLWARSRTPPSPRRGDQGVRFFDTAPYYGRGLSEHRVGSFLIDKPREEFILTTKVGRYFRRPGNPRSFDRTPWGGGLNMEIVWDYSYDGIMRSYEQSLLRLGLDTVDALLIHDPEQSLNEGGPSIDDLARTGIKALEELKRSGHIKAIGMGLNATASLDTFARRVPLDFCIVAMPYTLLDQSGMHSGLSYCTDNNISVIIGAPYASGILVTGPGPTARYRYQIAAEDIQEKTRRIAEVCKRHGTVAAGGGAAVSAGASRGGGGHSRWRAAGRSGLQYRLSQRGDSRRAVGRPAR